MSDRFRVGVVGARGHTGAHLIEILSRNDRVDLTVAVSRQATGEPVPGSDNLIFETATPREIVRLELDAIFLALPDGAGGPYVEEIESRCPEAVVIDLSFDHRLDDGWVYGLPELGREKISGARRIANPGCYATALQLGLAPLLGELDGVPVVFGVSGYSGAGTTPSPRNDPAVLEDNLIPYALVEHNHELEAVRNLGAAIRFIPHVHPAFRGLLTTIHAPLRTPSTPEALLALFSLRYDLEALIEVRRDTPALRDGSQINGVIIGGFEVTPDGRNAVIVAVEDNLLKGASVQAVQNMNLALGLPELTGII